MGHISEYQQQQLASEAVGTPGVDNSGSILAAGVEGLASALTKRQEALDRVQYTNAYYDYAQQDELTRIKLQREYGAQPEAFDEAYKAANAEIVQAKRDALPERQRAKFDTLVARRNASILPANLAWKFGQQNKLGLERVEEGGTTLAISAQTWTTGSDYLNGLREYRARFQEVDAPLLDAASAQTAEKKYVRNATIMYAASMLDTNNGGALQFKMDLEQNEEFKAQIIEAVGADGYARLQKQAEKGVARLMSEQTYDMVKGFAFDKAAMGKLNALLNAPAGIALAQAEQDVIVTENALEQLKKDPNAGLYTTQIAVLEEQLKQNTAMAEIARNRDDIEVKSDSGVIADLQVKILQATAGISTKKEKAELSSEVQADERRAAQGSSLFGTFTFDFISDKKDGTKASKSYSEYLQNLYKIKGEILTERLKGNLSNKDADKLLTKFAEPMSSLGQYDKLQGGDNVYVAAYSAFDEYAKTISLRVPDGTSAGDVRRARDTIRTRMMTQFAEQVALHKAAMATGGSPDFEPSATASQNLIGATIENFARALTPQKFRGLKEGQIVTVGGKPVKFAGYNRSTGQMAFETPASLDASLGNT